MSAKHLPFSREQLEEIAARFPTPFHLYVEQGLRQAARSLLKAFSWAPGFREFFAVKATPNPHLLAILRAEGLGADCSSLPELLLAEAVGMRGEEIMFSSNVTPAEEFRKTLELGGIINLDDLSHLPYLQRHCGIPELLCFRYNPGPAREGNAIIGKPEESKFGCTRAQVLEGYRLAREGGARRFGLHTMVASNERNPAYFVETARMLFDLALEVKERLGLKLEFINLGGGIGIPYRPEDQAPDLDRMSAGIRQAYEELIRPTGLHPLRLCMENGRMITGPHGYLISRVRHKKAIYKNYLGLDATMANLMRPGMYGSYHHLTVLGKESLPATEVYDVTGSLCENNDKFAIDRPLPPVEIGDLVAIHDAGAHGHAMGFNYNGKLRSAELLLAADGSVRQIRRAETVRDHFATLEFPGL